jgi:hypothetical protein
MKILLVVAGVVVLLILVVVGVGALLPKRHVASRSAAYRATPEQLFTLIAGTQNWRPDVVSSEMIPDAEGRQLMRETARSGGTMTYEVLDVVAPKSIKRRIATPNLPFSGSWTYTLQPGDGVTIVRITEDAEVYNPVFRFVGHFILGETRTMDTYLRALGKATGEDVDIRN